MHEDDPTPLGRLVLVDPTTGCWLWQLAVDKDGYGRRGKRGGSQYAHRYVYEMYTGPIPEGLELDHTCRRRRCVRPNHLEPVTHPENMRRSREARRGPRCINGHLWTDETRYIDKRGKWGCRICNRAAVRRYQERKKKNA